MSEKQLLADLKSETELNILFVSNKIKLIRDSNKNNRLDIKDLSDLQRYAETLNFLSLILVRSSDG